MNLELKCGELLLEAQKEALRLRSPYTEPEHVLIVDMKRPDGVIRRLAKSKALGAVSLIHVQKVLESLVADLPAQQGRRGAAESSLRLKACLDVIPRANGKTSRQEIVMAILNIKQIAPDDSLGIALLNAGVELAETTPSDPADLNHTAPQPKDAVESDVLSNHCVELVKLAGEGKLSDAIGRAWEIENVILTLRMKSNNNPLLIGDPGVGKTQIVEALAKRIHEGTAGQRLSGIHIYRLDVGSLTSGTQYRGMFEERLKGIIDSIKALKGKAILFVDEIHLLLGAGKTEGSMDAANLIKPELARGELPLIGATTYTEFRTFFEKDEAFRSRFNEIAVEEPTEMQTLDILRGSGSEYSRHHDVKISDDAIGAIVSLCKRYVTEECFPRKAFKVLDKVCAAVGHARDKGERRDGEVTVRDVVREISGRCGIPVEVLENSAGERLLSLGITLRNSIVGQEQAIETVVSKLQVLTLPRGATTKPRGVFFFAGPSGVGKTEIARILARELYGTAEHFLKLNMADYTESHSASRLLGADPGTIGYEEGGALTEPIRRRPSSLVLLDEIEKAHPAVCKVFLNVFDEARVRDSRGNVIDFSNCVFIMTSNLGFSGSMDTPPTDGEIKNLLARGLGNEFVGRIQTTIVFKHLSAEDVEKIVDLTLDSYSERFAHDDQKLTIDIEDAARKHIVENGYQKELGARSVIGYMEQSILEQVAQERIAWGQKGRKHEIKLMRISLSESQQLIIQME